MSGLLLASVLSPGAAAPALSALCSTLWAEVRVVSAWWPSTLVDLIVNFEVDGSPHVLVLEHKHVNSNSDAPGYRSVGGALYWQTESMLREIDRVRDEGEAWMLGGPYDPDVEPHLVVLDARGRTMDEAFELGPGKGRHRHDAWSVVAYGDLAARLRDSYDAQPEPALQPLLGQLFASEAERASR